MMKKEIDMSRIMELKLAYLETEVRRDLSTVLYEYSAFVDDVTAADKKPFTSYEFKCMLERIEKFKDDSSIDIRETKAEEPELGKVTATAFPSGGITNGLFFGSYEEKTLREILNNSLEDDIKNFYKFKSTSSSFISILNSIQDFQNANLDDYAKLNCTMEITKLMLPLDNNQPELFRIENYLREDDAIFINFVIRENCKALHNNVMQYLIAKFNKRDPEHPENDMTTFKIENGIQPYGSQLDCGDDIEKMQLGNAVEISIVDSPSKAITSDILKEKEERINGRFEKINEYFEFFDWLKKLLQNIQRENKAGIDADAAIEYWESINVPSSETENVYNGDPNNPFPPALAIWSQFENGFNLPPEEGEEETTTTTEEPTETGDEEPSPSDLENEKAAAAHAASNLLNSVASIETDINDIEIKTNAYKIQTVFVYSSKSDLSSDIEESDEKAAEVVAMRHKRIADEIRHNLAGNFLHAKCFKETIVMSDELPEPIYAEPTEPQEEEPTPEPVVFEPYFFKTMDEYKVYCNTDPETQGGKLSLLDYKNMLVGMINILKTWTATNVDVFNELTILQESIPELNEKFKDNPDDPDEVARTYLDRFTAVKTLFDTLISTITAGISGGKDVEDSFKNKDLLQLKEYVKEMHDILLKIVTEVLQERDYNFEDIALFMKKSQEISQDYDTFIDENRAVMRIFKKDANDTQP